MQLALVLLFALTVTVHTMQVEKAKVSFTVSGRGLPDADIFRGETDGYVKIYLKENSGKTEVGETATVNDNSNPEWPNVFTFNFERRGRKQLLIFDVYGKNESFRDKFVGNGKIKAVDLVDNQLATKVLLSDGGYLLVQKTTRSA